jgi:hypothetical protein
MNIKRIVGALALVAGFLLVLPLLDRGMAIPAFFAARSAESAHVVPEAPVSDAEQLQRTSQMFAAFAYEADSEIICTQPLARNILVDRAHWQMSADLDCGPVGKRVTYLVSWTRGKSDIQPEEK